MRTSAPESHGTQSSTSAQPSRACSSWMSLRAERPTDWTHNQLHKLIDYRTRKEVPTWFTTNCSLEELELLITPRCSSRLATRADVMARDRPGRGLRLCR